MLKVASVLQVEQYYVGDDPQRMDVVTPAQSECGHFDLTIGDSSHRSTDLDLSREDFSPLAGVDTSANEGDDAMNVCCSVGDGKGFYADSSDSEMTDVTISDHESEEPPAKKNRASMPPTKMLMLPSSF